MPKQKSKRGTHPENYNQYWGFAVIFVMLGMDFFVYFPFSETHIGPIHRGIIRPLGFYFAIPQIVLILYARWYKMPFLRYCGRAIIVGILTIAYPIIGFFFVGLILLPGIALLPILSLATLVIAIYVRLQYLHVPRKWMMWSVAVCGFVSVTLMLFSLMMAVTQDFHLGDSARFGDSMYYIIRYMPDSVSEPEYIARYNSLGLNCEHVTEIDPLSKDARNLHVEGDTLQILDWDGNVLAEYKP